MSLYFVKGKGWRYDFTLNGKRYTKTWFKTKKDARQEEAMRKEEVENPEIHMMTAEDPIDIDFLELVNRRLDHLKEYCSERHYTDHIYYARRWCALWKDKVCDDITVYNIQSFLLKRKKEVSAITANKELRLLRSLFNYGIKAPRKWISKNPTEGIMFFPIEKNEKYVPSKEDVLKVFNEADPDSQDYLWTIVCTLGRVSEVNRLQWKDVNLKEKFLVLYTRKKKGGHFTPRRIPLNQKLFNILSEKSNKRDNKVPWVFWHRYWSVIENNWVVGPYKDRKRLMTTLCNNAGVKYFRYHALRHFGASMLENENVPIGVVQRILGHGNRRTTEIYLHSVGDGERIAVDCLYDGLDDFSHTDSHTK